MAVPQVRRSQRNHARKADASLILAQTRECLINNMQKLTSCDTMGKVGISVNQLQLATDVVYCGSGGTTAETRCTDGYTHPSGNYSPIPLLSTYSNNSTWSISSDIPLVVVDFAKTCQQSVVNPTANGRYNDMVAIVTLEKPIATQTICYTS